jgi:hypothetical protein
MSKVENMTSGNGYNKVANQFIITDEGRGALGNFIERKTFQSYNSIIAVITRWPDSTEIELDERYWDYSKTTGKYRNMFLGEDKKETQRKIDAGIYKLVNLNK